MQALASNAERIVYSSESRMKAKGLKARATAWGWTWIDVSDGGKAVYLSAGVSERVKNSVSAVFHRCKLCGYTEAALSEVEETDMQHVCPSCLGDSAAIQALAVQDEAGVNLGWRTPNLRERWKLLGIDEARGFTDPAHLSERGDRRLNRPHKVNK